MGSDLSGRESMRHQEEKILVGTTAGQQEAAAAAVDQDHCTDLKELQADRTDIRSCQFSAFQCQAPDRLDQCVGE